jgi:hypothetical protein
MEFGSWKGMAIFIAPFICVIFVGLEVKSARAGTSDSRRGVQGIGAERLSMYAFLLARSSNQIRYED